MKCDEVVEWMHRYLDHDLGEAETEQLLQHVATCPACAENFSLLRALSRELEDLPQVTPKFSLVDAIMPQLDAIDEARKEQSSTIQEMSPVPAAIESLQRSGERKPKQQWLNTMVGRMSVGAAAAVVVLGFAIWGYQPEKLENADVMMMSSGGSAESQASDPNALSKDVTDNDASAAKRHESDAVNSGETRQAPETLESPEAQDSAGEQEKLPVSEPDSTGVPTESTSEPATSQDQPSKDAPSGTNPADSPQSSVGEASPGVEQKTESSDSALPPATPDETESAANSADPENFATNSEAPETKEGDVQKGITAPNVQDGTKSSDGAMGLVGPNQGIASTSVPKEWSSPDGAYTVMQTDNQLSLYARSADDPAALNLVEQRELEGTLTSAGWTSDGTTFNYSTDQNGTTVKKYFAVSPASGETSAK